MKKNNQGFTLIELAISVAILGLVLSAGLLTINPLVKGMKIRTTSDRLDNVENAITAYVIQNGNLPCPAQNINNPQSFCTANAVQHGLLPWRSLGLQKNEVIDGWGKMIDYVVDRKYTSSGTVSLNCSNSGIPQEDWGNFTSSINLIDQTGGLVPNDFAKLSYLLISHGENGSGAIMPSGQTYSFVSNMSNEERSNLSVGIHSAPNSLPAIYYSAIPDGSTSVGFDDVLVGKSAARIMIGIGCTGK